MRITPTRITFSERRIYGDTAVEFAPWYVYEFPLSAPADTVHYDADGLPDDYPWMRYDVNSRYPQVKEEWKKTFEANIAAGFAVSQAR